MKQNKILIIDIGSFVLPYDYYLAKSLHETGFNVGYIGSNTKYNQEFLEALKTIPNSEVITENLSSSIAKLNTKIYSYLKTLFKIFSLYFTYSLMNIQFIKLPIIEIPFYFLLRKKIIFTIHNPVPHNYKKNKYIPFQIMATISKEIWFPSQATADAFFINYSSKYKTKSRIVQHGTLGITPNSPTNPYKVPKNIEGIGYWGNVKPYKGSDLLLQISQRNYTNNRTIHLEVHGKWDKELYSIRNKIRESGTTVIDKFLDEKELSNLLSRNLVFILPYNNASQSGVLYTLLHHGCLFISTDKGDLGYFLRNFGLEKLLLRDSSLESLDECIKWLRNNIEYAVERLSEAQHIMSWQNSIKKSSISDLIEK